MHQVSSQLTLFLRLFIPVFFGVFVGALTAYIMMRDQAYYNNLKGEYVRFGLLAFYLSSMALLAFTVWRLRRVEMSREWVYVTDYFRQARYPWSNVESVSETGVGPLKLVNVRLFEPGSFGRRVTFLASASRWRMFKDEFSERLAERLR